MKNKDYKKIDDQAKNYQEFNDKDTTFKTSNINILLNRVRLEKKDRSKKRLIFSLSVISILLFLSIMVLGN